ncbi:MAG: TIGR03009 domain-containing protein [Planctomycetota bacterium]
MHRTLSSILCTIILFLHGYDPAWSVAQSGVDLQPPYPAVASTPVSGRPADAVGTQAANAPVTQVANLPQQPGQIGSPVAQRGMIGPPRAITPVEQQFVDQILQMWETEGARINTFTSRFQRWEYNFVWGPGANIPLTKSEGQVHYSKPDKGSFKIEKIRRWTKQNPQQETWEPGDWILNKDEVGEHWVCDGKAVFQYRHEKKQLVVQPLPPEMQGKSIVDGPLPFLFGAEAEKLKRRYWIYSKQSDPETIWLEAYPRSQSDAANYSKVDVMLDRKSMQPKAIRVYDPNSGPNNGNHAVYMFESPKVNGNFDAIFGSLFNAPRTPLGWKRVVQNPPVGSQAGPHATNPQPTATR